MSWKKIPPKDCGLDFERSQLRVVGEECQLIFQRRYQKLIFEL